MYAWFARLGVGHEAELSPSNEKPTDEPLENVDVENQFENDNVERSSSESRQELVEGWAPNCPDAEGDVLEDNDIGDSDNKEEISDSNLEENDDDAMDSDSSDVDHLSF